MTFRTILLFGAPGCGKGTQGKILGAIPNFFHCSCGEVFRSMRFDSDLGQIFAEHSSRGELVPDEPTVRLWRHFIDSTQHSGRFDPATDLLVLDGIPRNARQAEMLSDTLDVRAIFYLTCADLDQLIQRLQRRALRENRLDDANLDVIRSRLETYERESKLVLDYYGPGILRPIDATKTPVGVLQDILTTVAAL